MNSSCRDCSVRAPYLTAPKGPDFFVFRAILGHFGPFCMWRPGAERALPGSRGPIARYGIGPDRPKMAPRWATAPAARSDGTAADALTFQAGQEQIFPRKLWRQWVIQDGKRWAGPGIVPCGRFCGRERAATRDAPTVVDSKHPNLNELRPLLLACARGYC